MKLRLFWAPWRSVADSAFLIYRAA
jgi:hypothetical protein